MTARRPNFLLIIADDLGYSDLGCFGGEIRTPNIDRLAQEGIRFSDYHTAPMCSVARAMVMSGTDNHVAMQHLMVNRETQNPDNYNTAGNEGYLTRNIAAMPELLKDAGYRTFMSGKWHLGFRPGYLPSDRGFDKVFSCLPASSNHFGFDPKWEGEEEGRAKVHGHQPPIYVEQDNRFEVDGYYSSQAFADKLLTYLHDRPKDDKPFFAYLPFTAPHYPLQCFREDRERYRGVYDAGPAALRLRRLESLVRSGIIDSETVPHDVISPENAPWDELSPKEQRYSARAMECYAGMVDCMDQQIGKVIDYLRESGELDNTVVMFFSDNGAEGTALEVEEVVGPWLIEVINASVASTWLMQKYYNNEYDNIGNFDSFSWMGPRWCQASTAPNRLYKHYTTEGGIRVPFVMRYPGFNQPAGSICRAFSTAMDILPTFLELAGASHPNQTPSHPRETAKYHERQVFPMRGRSWAPYLRSDRKADDIESEAIYGLDDPVVAWEHYGKAALRHGRWKIVNMPPEHPTGTGRWQLYDMYSDQGETKDLAVIQPEKVKELLVQWETWLQETGAHYHTPLPSAEGFLERDIIGDQKAWMRLGHGEKFDDAF